MIGRLQVVLILVFGIGLLHGCDTAPEPPVISPASKTEPQKPKAPTTQELLTSRRKSLTLVPLPLKLMVPPGWELQSLDVSGITFLQGYSPSGMVQIQLGQRGTMSQERIDYLLAGANREKKEKPDTIKLVDFRPLGEMNVLERQSVGQSISLPEAEKSNADTSPEYRWTWTLFIPRGKDFAVYELNFLGLSCNHFNADAKFLRSVLESVKPDGEK